jgi:glutamate 5-kinase
MITKLMAARLSTASGTDVVIASGREPDVLLRLVQGEPLGTLFPAAADRLESRKRWILSGLSVRGSLVVDDGAEKALRERKTSLLPAGVKEVCGTFARGETIEIVTSSGKRLGSGIANYGSEEMNAIKGARSSHIASLLGHDYGAEAVHRDNLVVT